MSRGQPNVNLLSFVSAKHKPITMFFSSSRSILSKDDSLLCYSDLDNQVVNTTQPHALSREHNDTSCSHFPDKLPSVGVLLMVDLSLIQRELHKGRGFEKIDLSSESACRHKL